MTNPFHRLRSSRPSNQAEGRHRAHQDRGLPGVWRVLLEVCTQVSDTLGIEDDLGGEETGTAECLLLHPLRLGDGASLPLGDADVADVDPFPGEIFVKDSIGLGDRRSRPLAAIVGSSDQYDIGNSMALNRLVCPLQQLSGALEGDHVIDDHRNSQLILDPPSQFPGGEPWRVLSDPHPPGVAVLLVMNFRDVDRIEMAILGKLSDPCQAPVQSFQTTLEGRRKHFENRRIWRTPGHAVSPSRISQISFPCHQ